MSDLFVSLVAISTAPVRLEGQEAGRAPGVTPNMKDGIWAERALAPTGAPTRYLGSAFNAIVVP